MEIHLRTTGCRLPYGITQCYLPVATRHKRTQPALTPDSDGWYSSYLPRWDGRLGWSRWLATYWDGLSAHRRSPIQVLTGPGVASSLPAAVSSTTQHRHKKFLFQASVYSLLLKRWICNFALVLQWSPDFRLKVPNFNRKRMKLSTENGFTMEICQLYHPTLVKLYLLKQIFIMFTMTWSKIRISPIRSSSKQS